jgi:tight adherence protein B
MSWEKADLRKRENLKTGGSFRKQGKPEDTVVDYENYSLSLQEWVLALGAGVALAGVTAHAFYRSWLAFLIFLIPAGFCPGYFQKYWKQKRMQKLELQFKEAIQILSSSLSAGYSVENAIASCQKELKLMYGAEGMMTKEMAYMVQQMEMNRPVELLMSEFASRSGLEEVENFARIFAIAKRSGGQLVPIISHTVEVMNDRFRVKEEIRTLTASRKFEQKIMSLMPFLMIFYIDATSPGFFNVMYTTVMGRLIMSGCLAVYLLSVYLSGKILDIQVG